MANRKQTPDDTEGATASDKPGYRGGARTQTEDTGVRQGSGKGQSMAGERDERGLTIDSTIPKDNEAPTPGDAAKGPWAVHPEPKGD